MSQLQSTDTEPLTPREKEVLYELLNPSMEQIDIAKKLVITKDTVTSHTINIYSKLQVSTRFEAVLRFAQIDLEFRRALIRLVSRVVI